VKNSSRALLAVALLAGFPVLMLAVIALMTGAEVFAFRDDLGVGLRLAVLAVPIVYVLLRALLVLGRSGGTPRGLAVTPAEQPELWATVQELAHEVGTRPPDEIYLVSEANAGVQEQTDVLGLRARRRRMFIGAQLFAGLRTDQLRAILGHELGHYSNRHTRLGSVTYRGRQSIKTLLAGLQQSAWSAWMLQPIFTAYAALYFQVSMRVSRAQELAADAAAARVGGTAAAASALRETDLLDGVWAVYADEYVEIAWAAGYSPEQLFEGFRQLLADPARAASMAALRRNPPERPTSRYDSHPATAERIAVLEAAPTVPVPAGGERPATELLRDAPATLEAAMRAGLTAEGRAKQPLDWPRLVDIGMRKSVQEKASSILRHHSLNDLLAGPEQRPEREAGQARQRLSTVVYAQLAEAGIAHWELSWSGPAKLVLPAPYAAELAPALDAAIVGDAAPLRALLALAGR